MKRKISILTLVLLFFAANTALPFTLHICRMLEMKESCNHMVPKKDFCCEEENKSETSLSQAYDQCCLAKIVDPSLKENYIGSKTELSQKVENTILNLPVTLPLKSTFNNTYSYFSPPPLNIKNIFLINSILLI